MIDCTTYAHLAQIVQGYAEGQLGLLILVGPPGVAKTTALRQAMSGRECLWADGNLSAIALYCELYDHRGLPVVLDDVDGLYSDKAAVRLLKGLCATEDVNTLRWNSGASMLKQRGVPRQFDTASQVCIIANEWKALNSNVGAVQDRGHMVLFAPSKDEIHEQAGQWFWDNEVYQFVYVHLPLVGELSMRDYVLAAEQKQAGLDWRAGLLARWDVKARRFNVVDKGELLGHVWAHSKRQGAEIANRFVRTIPRKHREKVG